MLLIAGIACWLLIFQETPPDFSGERALRQVRKQVSFGPRIPGTAGHQQTKDYLLQLLKERADQAFVQTFTYTDKRDTTRTFEGANIVASFNVEASERVLLGAHWDTRPQADQSVDSSRSHLPVPGANDGASGVAVLLEMARLMEERPPEVGVDIVLFDMEDFGDDGDSLKVKNPFAIGSRHFASNLEGYRPDYGILVDMVCDENLRIPQEAYSRRYAEEVVRKVWEAAEEVEVNVFLDQAGRAVMDDHVPLIKKGIPVVGLIHTPFPWYWHTTADTPDKCSAGSLAEVGQVVTKVVYEEGSGIF